MKLQRSQRNSGFTLIEMIGVLAIIALLAGMLVPRIVQAIKEARIQSTVVSLNTLKAAVAQYYAKNGTLADLDSDNADQTLVQEGLLDKPFEVKVGSSASVLVAKGNNLATGTPNRYNLDGNSNTPAASQPYETKNAANVVEVKLEGVSLEDARALSLAIDGSDSNLTPEISGGTYSDTNGRVVYDNANKIVYIYIAHE